MNLNVSMAEAAKLLGIQVARLQKLVEAGDVPAWRDGRNWKIPRSALEKWNEERAYKQAERRKHEQETFHSTGDGEDSAGDET